MTTATVRDTRKTIATARHWIDGRWRDSPEHRDSINPATGEVIGRYAFGGEGEAREAVDKASVERVNRMVDDALAAGAGAVVRGGPVTDGPLARGAFYRPTLLEVTDARLAIVQEEVFGAGRHHAGVPHRVGSRGAGERQQYGLAASIWTRDADRPLRIGRELQAGTVWVNDWAMMRDEFEEGGYKQSGRGRLRGLSTLDDFLEYKHIVLRPGVVAPAETRASGAAFGERDQVPLGP